MAAPWKLLMTCTSLLLLVIGLQPVIVAPLRRNCRAIDKNAECSHHLQKNCHMQRMLCGISTKGAQKTTPEQPCCPGRRARCCAGPR